MTFDMMRQELRDVREYYCLKDALSEIEGEKELDLSALKKKAAKYNKVIVKASPKLIRLYHALYIKGISQNKVASAWSYTPEYIRQLCRKLEEFLFEQINQSQKEIS